MDTSWSRAEHNHKLYKLQPVCTATVCAYTPKVGTENTGGGAGECLVRACTYMSCECGFSGVLRVFALVWYIL